MVQGALQDEPLEDAEDGHQQVLGQDGGRSLGDEGAQQARQRRHIAWVARGRVSTPPGLAILAHKNAQGASVPCCSQRTGIMIGGSMFMYAAETAPSCSSSSCARIWKTYGMNSARGPHGAGTRSGVSVRVGMAQERGRVGARCTRTRNVVLQDLLEDGEEGVLKDGHGLWRRGCTKPASAGDPPLETVSVSPISRPYSTSVSACRTARWRSATRTGSG